MFKVNKRHENKVSDVVLVSLLLTLKIFHISSTASIVNFEQVNICWHLMSKIQIGYNFHDLINNNHITAMLCAIWYRLYNFKNVKNTHEGMLLFVKLQALSLQLY